MNQCDVPMSVLSISECFLNVGAMFQGTALPLKLCFWCQETDPAVAWWGSLELVWFCSRRGYIIGQPVNSLQSRVTMPAAMLLPRHQSCKQSFSRFSRFFQRQPVVTTPFHHRPPLPTLSPTRRASSFALRPSPTPTPPTRTRRLLSTTPAATMASDDAYLAFLNKANQDSSEGRAATASTSTDSNSPFTTTSAGVTVPRVLQQVTQRDDLVYVSDADEPFYPVALKFSGEGKGGGLPDEGLYSISAVCVWFGVVANTCAVDRGIRKTDWT